MSNENEIALENILGTKYARFITYPSTEAKEAKDRVEQLAALGISRLTLQRPHPHRRSANNGKRMRRNRTPSHYANKFQSP